MSKPTPSGHRARKRFGQNFLIDQNVINNIVRSLSPKADDRIVEIGPGQGALTGLLLEANENIQVVELDRDLVPVLLSQFAKYQGFKIHQGDALKFDFSSLLRDKDDSLRIIGNLPYNISTPLIFRLLDNKHYIRDMHFMLQKEVVQRLAAQPREKNYGRLSVMTQYHCQVDALFDVPPECFHPAPKVNSAVVRLTPHTKLPLEAKNLANFDTLVKTAFQQRRKTLRNGLKQIVSDKQAENIGLDLSLRAETLSVERYIEISNALWGSEDIVNE